MFVSILRLSPISLTLTYTIYYHVYKKRKKICHIQTVAKKAIMRKTWDLGHFLCRINITVFPISVHFKVNLSMLLKFTSNWSDSYILISVLVIFHQGCYKRNNEMTINNRRFNVGRIKILQIQNLNSKVLVIVCICPLLSIAMPFNFMWLT